jgi:hypothetical protein
MSMLFIKLEVPFSDGSSRVAVAAAEAWFLGIDLR